MWASYTPDTFDALVIPAFLALVALILWFGLYRPARARRHKARLWNQWMQRVGQRVAPEPVVGNRHQRRAAKARNRARRVRRPRCL